MAEKGIAMTIDEARRSITQAVNAADLPFCILEPILKDLHDQSVIGARQELNQEQDQYKKDLEREKQQEVAPAMEPEPERVKDEDVDIVS